MEKDISAVSNESWKTLDCKMRNIGLQPDLNCEA